MTGKLNIILVATLTAFALGACESETEEFSSQENTAYESEEKLESAFGYAESITNAGMNYVESMNSSGKTAANHELSCAAITFIGTQESGKLEINFGTEGCVGSAGRLRKGKVIIEFTGNRFEKGSVVYTVFEDFYLDELKIEGTRRSENISASITNPEFDITVTEGKVVWPDESFALWNTERTHSWTYSAQQSLELSIVGVSYGTTRDGTEYTSEINSPVVFKSNCLAESNYIPSSGTKTIYIDSLLDIYVNYGDGNCDNEFTVSAGNRSKTINM